MSWLSDEEWEEEVRCAALGLEGPNAKSYRREFLLGGRDEPPQDRLDIDENPRYAPGNPDWEYDFDRDPGDEA